MTVTTKQTFARVERFPVREQAVTVNKRTYIQKGSLIHVVITHKES